MQVKLSFFDRQIRIGTCCKLYDLIASGFSGAFNSRYYKLLSETQKIKIENLIKEWELDNIINKEFQSLSDGQKRRALLARALVYEPNILVLDEPFSNLDLKSNFILNKNLNCLIDKSVNIVYVTHNLESILAKTNRVILFKGGQIVNDGNPNQIINSKIISDLFRISIKVIKQDEHWKSFPINT